MSRPDHSIIGEPADPLLRLALLDVPEGQLLEAAGGQRLAVGAERHRLDQRDVGGLRLLPVGRLQLRVDERLRVVAGLAVVVKAGVAGGRQDVAGDLVPAAVGLELLGHPQLEAAGQEPMDGTALFYELQEQLLSPALTRY